MGLSSSSSVAAPFTNGSFELPGGPMSNNVLPGGATDITGWTTILNGVEWFMPSAFPGLGSAQDGSWAVDLAWFNAAGGGIEQSFTTTAGQSYVLEFFGGTLQSDGRDGTGLIEVAVGGFAGSFAVANVGSSTIAWQRFVAPFTATTATTTLTFSNRENPLLHFAMIDNVSIRAVPEPGVVPLVSCGLLSVVLARRRGLYRRNAGQPGK